MDKKQVYRLGFASARRALQSKGERDFRALDPMVLATRAVRSMQETISMGHGETELWVCGYLAGWYEHHAPASHRDSVLQAHATDVGERCGFYMRSIEDAVHGRR